MVTFSIFDGTHSNGSSREVVQMEPNSYAFRSKSHCEDELEGRSVECAASFFASWFPVAWILGKAGSRLILRSTNRKTPTWNVNSCVINADDTYDYHPGSVCSVGYWKNRKLSSVFTCFQLASGVNFPGLFALNAQYVTWYLNAQWYYMIMR